MVLQTAISIHLVLDLQDVACLLSQVHSKTPQVKSFFSQHDHFEYSHIAVQQDDQQNEEALVTSDFWQVDGLRREFIRHHREREREMNVHEMQRAETTPIPKEQLLDERETHSEYQKSGRKVLRKNDWRDKKNMMKRMDELWKSKTIYKIKDDYVTPEAIQKSDVDRLTRVSKGSLDDLFHPEAASSSKLVSVQKKPSSQQREVGKKKLTRGPSLKEIEAGPPEAKRHVRKQKPVVVDDSKEGSSKERSLLSQLLSLILMMVKINLIGLPGR